MSSFYEFLNDMNKQPSSVPTMDAEVMRKHPDGSPCYAKKEEDCPIISKAKKADEADGLGAAGTTGSSQTQTQSTAARHLGELFGSTLPQIMKQVSGAEGITYSQLEEAYVDLQDEAGKWKPSGTVLSDTRKRRDEVFAKHKDDQYESFDLSTGEKVTDADGKWGVTFHTTSAEKDMSDQDYDGNVAKFAELLGAKPQVGVYEGSCEISYACGSLLKSAAAMVMCEQKAIFGYMRAKTAVKPEEFGVDIVNFTFDRGVNELDHPDKEKYL